MAPGLFLAVVLAGVDQQGVVLIVQRGVMGEMLHEETLYLPVSKPFPDNSVPYQYSAGVCVHYKDLFPSGIEEHTVGRLFANALDLKQFFAQSSGFFSKHGVQVSMKIILKKCEEGFQPSGLDIVIS